MAKAAASLEWKNVAGVLSGARPSISAKCTPEISSITTYCGSLIPANCATSLLLFTPKNASSSHTATEGTRRMNAPSEPESKGASTPTPRPPSVDKLMPTMMNQVNGCDSTAINNPTSEPQVPGAGFR